MSAANDSCASARLGRAHRTRHPRSRPSAIPASQSVVLPIPGPPMSANAPAAASAPRNSRKTSYSGSRPTIRASRSLLACTAPLSQTADPQTEPILARRSQLLAAAHRRCVEGALVSADSYETLARGQPESRCRPLLLDESARANRPSQHCRDGRAASVRRRAVGVRPAPLRDGAAAGRQLLMSRQPRRTRSRCSIGPGSRWTIGGQNPGEARRNLGQDASGLNPRLSQFAGRSPATG